jgi:UrcA family protein
MTTKTLATALTAALFAAQLAAPLAAAGERRADTNPYDSVALVTLKVQASDLDPTTSRGAKALHRRIVLAAERICYASLNDRRGLAKTREVKRANECFENTVNAAVADVRATVNVDIEQLAGVDRQADGRLSAAR